MTLFCCSPAETGLTDSGTGEVFHDTFIAASCWSDSRCSQVFNSSQLYLHNQKSVPHIHIQQVHQHTYHILELLTNGTVGLVPQSSLPPLVLRNKTVNTRTGWIGCARYTRFARELVTVIAQFVVRYFSVTVTNAPRKCKLDRLLLVANDGFMRDLFLGVACDQYIRIQILLLML